MKPWWWYKHFFIIILKQLIRKIAIIMVILRINSFKIYFFHHFTSYGEMVKPKFLETVDT